MPAAYRVFFRHIGLDPDVERTPIEAAVLERMLRGGFLTGGLLEDVLLIALLDTGVPVWALDAEHARRPARDPRRAATGERARALARRAAAAGRAGSWSPTPRRALAVLFGELAPGARAAARARARLTLFAVQVAGVPDAVRRGGAVELPGGARAALRARSPRTLAARAAHAAPRRW